MRIVSCSCALVAILFAVSASAAPPIDFNRDIRPLLSNNCFFCHGPDAAERKGGVDGLRLDTADGAATDLGDGKKAIVSGKPEASVLIERVTSDDPDLQMPPKSKGKRLTPAEVELLKEWIRQGAKYAKHWSYEKPVRPAVPAVRNAAWPRTDIDRFLLARLESEGLAPAPEADRFTLIRRASLDLTGLPPTPEEVDLFLADKSEDAYGQMIDRLLAKESYGEHWARMWLDLARYADSAGYADDPQRTIWAYRDYVIRSYNANKPFDQFTIEQLAGDLLPEPTRDQIIATAFHRNTMTNSEGGTNDEEFRNVAIVDRVNTTMAVWMGTTIACAQCHTHKFDPLTQEEFFKLFAILNQTDDADRRDESPLLELWSPEQLHQKEQWKEEIAKRQGRLSTMTPALAAEQAEWEKSLPKDLTWTPLVPAEVTATSGQTAMIQPDGVVRFDKGAAQDSYRVVLPIPNAAAIQAIRLETVPDEALPGKGAGFGGGNFVVTGLSARIEPPADQRRTTGRFVRIEIPGSQKILSLAEVEVLSGNDNLALKGTATQSSTDYNGPAPLATDGITDGDFAKGSVTHTAISDNPWWEVDLGSEVPFDRLVIWNRTQGVEDRLSNFRVAVLSGKREPVWEQTIAEAPRPSRELSLDGARTMTFTAAFADHSQAGFPAANVLDEAAEPAGKGKKRKAKADDGWAVGGAIDQPHQLTLIPEKGIEVPAGSRLVLTIDQKSSHKEHVLGRFKVSFSTDASAGTLAQIPANILAIARISADKRDPAQSKGLADYYLSVAPALEVDRIKLAEVQKKLAEAKPETTVPVMKELAAASRRKTNLQHRGNFLDLGQEVSAGVPAIFPPLKTSGPVDRLALARWLVDEDNPLTPRVLVNQYWEQMFGVGLVRTSEEFGSQGELPSHPELLDWLATEIIRLKWDTKALLKEIVMSAAYRQSSKVTPEAYERDPENRLLARGPRFRLPAETIRDQALFVSGLLSSKMYGPPAKPPQPAMGLSAAFGGGIDWQTSAGEDKYRRGLYTTWRRSNPYPSMTTFDAPNREVCTVRRTRTNTPLQALVVLNDPVYLEAAQALARKMVAAGGTPEEHLRDGFRRVLSRSPEPAESGRLLALYEQLRGDYEKSPDAAKAMATKPLGPLPGEWKEPELAAWTVVANVLLNLDEFLMKR